MVYQSCSFYDLKADAERASLVCFSLTVLHVLDSSTPKPVFLNRVSLRPLVWSYGSCFATAPQPKLLCWVWLYGVCIMVSVGILNVSFQTTCISWSQPPPQPILEITSQRWQITDRIENVQQFCEGFEDPIWETSHEMSNTVGLHLVPQETDVQGQMLWSCGNAVVWNGTLNKCV